SIELSHDVLHWVRQGVSLGAGAFCAGTSLRETRGLIEDHLEAAGVVAVIVIRHTHADSQRRAGGRARQRHGALITRLASVDADFDVDDTIVGDSVIEAVTHVAAIP